MKKIFYPIASVFTLVLFFACIKENNMASNANVSIPFNDTMGIKIILNKCSGSQCHSLNGNASGNWLYNESDYERSIKKNIGLIIEVAGTFGKNMAGSKFANLTQADIDLLKNWFAAGFPNGVKNNKVLFSHTVMQPWFEKNCASCHAEGKTNAAQWKYDATDFTNSIKNYLSVLKKVIVTNKTMPPAGASNQEILAVEDWINLGAPSNN